MRKIDDPMWKLGSVGSKLAFKENFFFPSSVTMITVVILGTMFFQMFAMILAK